MPATVDLTLSGALVSSPIVTPATSDSRSEEVRPQSLLIRDTRKLESAASPDPPSCHASVRPVYFSQYIDTLLLHPTIMPLLTSRRSLALAVTSLAFMAWMWHSAVASRVSPDGWNRGEYAGAEDVLSGWRAGVCRNVGVCGNWFGHGKGEQGTKLPSSLKRAPPYVLEYAPYVYLHSEEKFMPCDIGEHLMHTTPYLNYTPMTSASNRFSLDNLNDLNSFGDHVYLTSNDDPADPPPWLRGDRNIPTKPDLTSDGEESGLSSAPALILWTEKEGGIVDAFYFYFYSFNLGNTVAGWRFGNHVGDWEHTVVRFVNGEPQSMFFSEHSGGAAYEYSVVEKIGKRPITYSARGSHANYATPGTHYYAIPLPVLADHTDTGHLWDPAKNNYLYHYDLASDTLTPDADSSNAPTGWFHYDGRWGDRFYPLSDRRQYRVVGQFHYVNGPSGPKYKNLERTEICQNEGICVVQPSLTYHLEGVSGPEDIDGVDWPIPKLADDNPSVTVEFSGQVTDEAEGESADYDQMKMIRY